MPNNSQETRGQQLQSLLKVQHDLTDLNVQVSTKQVEINNAKQEINDLTRKERLSGLASSQEMTLQNAIVKTAE